VGKHINDEVTASEWPSDVIMTPMSITKMGFDIVGPEAKLKYSWTLDDFRAATDMLDGNILMVLSSDGEGNSHREAGDYWLAAFVPSKNGYGDVYLPKLTEELKRSGLDEEDVRTPGEGDAILAIVLT